MPDHLADRYERAMAYGGPAWLRLLWTTWEARVSGKVWMLKDGTEYAMSPTESYRALAVFPSESVARDSALLDWVPAALRLDALAEVGVDRVDVWPAFQPSFHGGLVLQVDEFLERVAASRIDVRTQLSTPATVSAFEGFEPIPSLLSVVPYPADPPPPPRPKPASQVSGVLRSPAPNRFKYMVSTTLWLAATPSGPLGAVLSDSRLALAAWPAPEFMTPIRDRDDFVPVRVGWGKDLLSPLADLDIPVLAAPNDRDGLLCTAASLALPDLLLTASKR